jgi:hypothetical protein
MLSIFSCVFWPAYNTLLMPMRSAFFLLIFLHLSCLVEVYQFYWCLLFLQLIIAKNHLLGFLDFHYSCSLFEFLVAAYIFIISCLLVDSCLFWSFFSSLGINLDFYFIIFVLLWVFSATNFPINTALTISHKVRDGMFNFHFP